MIGMKLVTHQTGPEGRIVQRLLIEETLPIERELYLGIVLDRVQGKPVFMASAAGGMEIEEVAAKTPELILKETLEPGVGLAPYQARKLAFGIGIPAASISGAVAAMTALAKAYVALDTSLAEINPFILTKDGKVYALDAKINLDDNALFRHKDLEAMADESQERPLDVRAHKASLNYIALDGTIGCLVNGAGLAMSTMDIIKYHGGEPANFLDVGGGVTADGAIEAFRIILSDPKVKGVLVNIFGGIAKCDLIAEALVKAGREVGFKVPVVVRLEGTNVDKAREILTAAKTELPTMQTATDLTDAAKKVVKAAGV
jgi:succinyl-CoA synthetase beta subunit